MLKQNVGTIDRVLRVIVGLVLIGYAVIGPDSSYKLLGWIGIVPLVTAFLGSCPAYSIIGIKTGKAETAEG